MAVLTHDTHRPVCASQVSPEVAPRLPTVLGALLVMALGWLGCNSVFSAQGGQAPEYQVKAAFLVNFPKYVDWPVEAFPATNSPIVIAVAGESDVAAEIQNVIANRSVNGRGLVLKRLAPGEATSSACHILFIPAAEQKRTPSLLAKRKDGVLTVGESDDFLERGGMINLARHDEKIALEVNLAAADKARIKVSAKLLSVASVVKGKAP